MISEGKKRIAVSLKNLTADMLEVISKEAKLTKSEILQQLLFTYTLSFWSEPNNEINHWKEWKDKNDRK